MKDSKEVVKEFNEIVNMTASDLESWLKSDDSRSAGWPKEDEDGESVGHDSGRKIVEILKANPDKKADKYTDEQIQHMRKVVSYCKRHLAQEEKSNNEKSAEEVKKTKSYASLKNWGHDPLKARGEGGEDATGEEEEEEEDEKEEDENEAKGKNENEEEEKQAGDKRKKANGAQAGANKKRETRQSKAAAEKEDGDEEDAEEDEDEGEDEEKKAKGQKNGQQKGGQKSNGQKKQKKDDDGDDNGEDEDEEGDDDDGGDDSGAKPKKGPNKGDTVSWNWGSGNPQGKVLDVKAEKTTIETKRGNKVSRDGDPEDPAVVLDTGKSKAIKSNHELN